MNKKLYYTLLIIAWIFIIGGVIYKFVVHSNFHGIKANDFVIIGMLLNLIGMLWKNKFDNK